MCQRNALTAVLVAGHLRNDLHGDIAGCGKAVRLVNICLTDNSSVLQHILQVNQITVVHMLCKIVCIVEMDQPLLVCLYDILRKQQPSCQILAYLSCHIITLHTVDDRILIGILLQNLFIITFDQRQDPVICCIAFSYKRTGIAVLYITSRHIEGTLCHDLIFYHILHFLYGNSSVHLAAFEINIIRDLLDLLLCELFPDRRLVRLGNCSYNFPDVKVYL